MFILISNDDGYQAPGIKALAKALSDVADIEVVAPERDRSAASQSLTIDGPVKLRQEENGFYSCSGTPADCVHLATNGLFGRRPDLVVSGINSGANMGDDVLYSGTVAAAMEGRFLGLSSIAVSMNMESPRHYDTGARVAAELIRRIADLEKAVILNVNVPDVPYSQLRGIAATRLGRRHPSGEASCLTSPRGGDKLWWIGLAGPEEDGGPGTDFHAVAEGYVSVTPLHTDFTHHPSLPLLASWLGKNGSDWLRAPESSSSDRSD